MQSRRGWAWGLAVGVSLLGGLWWIRSDSSKKAENPAPLASATFAARASNGAPHSPGGDLPAQGQGPRAGGSEREVFVRSGWSEVQVPAPQAEVLELRPSEEGSADARRERERAVTLQLQSAVLREELIPAAGRWVRDREAGERVREAALEALGRSRSEAAQEELARLWRDSEKELSEGVRRRVLELLHAGRRLEDSRTQLLLGVLRDSGASEMDRDQAAYSLALGAALQEELEQRLLVTLGEGEARARFLKRLRQIRASVGPRGT